MSAPDAQLHSTSASHPMVNLRVLLVTAITGLVALAVLGATMPQVLAFRDHAKKTAVAAVRAAANEMRAELDGFFAPGAAIVAQTGRLPIADIAGGPVADRSKQYENFIRAAEVRVDDSDAIAAAYVAQPDRSMAVLIRNSAKLRKIYGLPDEAAASKWLRSERYVATSTGRWGWAEDEGWRFVDRPLTAYDPTTRPWWRLVEKSEQTALSGVYRSNVDESIRMSLVAPLRDADGALMAVAGVDMHVGDLGRAVREIALSRHGFAFIARRDGTVIAHPALDLPKRLSKHVANAPSLLEIDREDRRDLILFDMFAGGGDEDVRQFDVAGQTWFGIRAPLRELPGGDVALYAGAPLSDFTEASEKALQSALIVSGVFALAVIAVGAVIARAIATPVRRATDAMQAIARLDAVETVLPERSLLAEIDALNHSVEVLRAAIRSFGRFAPTELVRDLVAMRQPLELGGGRREITVLFVDIEGFTHYTETEQHESVVQSLADYFEIICEAVARSGGTLDKFIGDGAMAFWGAPRDDADHTAHACDAVLAIMAGIERLNAQRETLGEAPLEARFGLHRGYAFVGNIGARDRFAYTALGDVVNMASRFESATRNLNATVLASKSVAFNAGRHAFEHRGEIALRGRSAKVDAYELTAR